MTLLLEIVGAWAALTALGLISAVGMCRSGHIEDVGRGYVEVDWVSAAGPVDNMS